MPSRSASATARDHMHMQGARDAGTVLVVDDEPTIGEIVSRYLRRAGYEATVATDGLEALALSEQVRPDLIVLDLMLPGADGLEVMRQIRARDGDAPAVILLTAKGEEHDKITGLSLGADDYVVKPFSPAELIARIDAVLRRVDPVPSDAAEPLRFDGLEIDRSARRALVDGEEVQLTQREFDLLSFLAENPGQVFSRDQLMDAVWGYAFYTDTSTVTVHVRRLRAKIEADPVKPERIQTVWGVGYRFEP
jgi:two-component system response regulator ResD